MIRGIVMAASCVSLILLSVLSYGAQEYTRGVGIYPGDPKEDFAPVLVTDTSTYRNLALHRPAVHSSSYDYNLTAQLVTDGIKESVLPHWLSTATSQSGVAPKNEREFPVDHNSTSSVSLGGPKGWLQFELAGGAAPYEIDRIELEARIRISGGFGGPGAPAEASKPSQPLSRPAATADWTCVVTGSEDGQTWKELGRAAGVIPPPPSPPAAGAGPMFGRGVPPLKPAVAFGQPARSRFYRIALGATGEGSWSVSEVAFFDKGSRVEVGGPYPFDSAWMSAGSGEEWVYVDLGARCSFDRVELYWIKRAAEGSIQVSDDAASWKDTVQLPAGNGLTDNLKLAQTAQGRYVRVLMKRPAAPGNYILSELEVFGRGGPVPKPKSAPAARPDGRLELAAGAWRLQRDSLLRADGAAISKPGFQDADWIAATVPGTVLSSFWNVGALPDPNYGDNQLMISDSFFYADFWYRTEFLAPRIYAGRRVWLNLDGVNWKADVFLNGEKVGRIEGAFMRGRFDVTERIRPGARNALAVRVEKNATPGSVKQKTLETAGLNGGALGADNPTYHASIGWDWIPTVRGRNIGIWNEVYLNTSGPVTIDNPFVMSTLPLPDTSRADVRIETSLSNHESKAATGVLRGRFGDATFEQSVTIEAASTKVVVVDPSTHPALRLREPKLWWPNGYGSQHLYDVELSFESGGRLSDIRSFKAGVRQLTYSDDGGTLRIWVNGRRFVGRGGNWGFPETNLRYQKREYDTAVLYHRDMNFTMIRNWVGQTGDEEFYDACDRYGIVIWQDFWLANPVDGPNPADDDLFLSNVRDFVQRIRSHPSVGLYCGRNEGNPPPAIDEGIRKALAGLHPDVHYISNSAFGAVSGGGPYAAQTPRYYFQYRATAKLHSELGMPNIVTMDSLRQMMPEAEFWPQGLVWGLHDFNLNSAQRLSGFRAIVDKSFGGARNAADWLTLAQFVNYDGYRAIFEAQSRNRMGILLWMSHPCWPSFVWQTYDYYFEPTAGYFGSKKGSEPLHIQWNPLTDNVEVVNYSAGRIDGLTAQAEILDMDGSTKWTKSASTDSAEDGVQTPIKLEYPSGLSQVHFIRLKLMKGGQVLSDNFYCRGTEEGNFTSLRTLPKVNLEISTRAEKRGSRWILTTELQNPGNRPALMVRLKAVRAKSGDRILPALYSDNYVSLMPGEERTIHIELEDADTRGEAPRIAVEGFNTGGVVER